MRILLVTQYFFPETGGTSNRVGALAREFHRLGHRVSIITEKPNHPRGVVFEGYRKGFFVEGTFDGAIPVMHAWVWARREKTFATRLLFYLSFMLTSVVAAVKSDEDCDVVVATSPPLFVGLSGWAISRLKRAKFVFDVRDLWPDVAVALGELSEGWLADVARRIERFLYRRADGITTVTKGFCRTIEDRVGSGTPVVRISNGTTPGVFDVELSTEDLRRELDLPEGYLVTYAGNLGLAQGLDHVVQAAETLEEASADVTFVLVGDGPLRETLRRTASEREVGNVLFRDRVPLDVAARYMAASDALLVPLGDRPIYRQFIPSKLFDSMAAGRPVLLSVDGEAREILEEAEAGIYYPAQDSEGLVRAVTRLKDSSLGPTMGRRGRAFVSERFTRAEQARKMARFLEERVVGGDGDPPPDAGSRTRIRT